MDLWSREPQRHKRSFDEMSHAATLSPSPIHFRDSAASNFFQPRSRFTSLANETISSTSHDRRGARRTSHPHNPPLQRLGDNMPSQSRSQLRPPLRRQESQTVIDLTEDSDEIDAPPAGQHGGGARSRRPPQLGRSDAENMRDVVDLTEDNEEEPEVIITGRRALSPRRRAPANANNSRPESPSLFMPAGPAAAIHFAFQGMHGGLQALFGGHGAGMGMGARGPAAQANPFGNADDFMRNLHFAQHEHFLPPRMDYRTPAFGGNQKPEHQAPPPPKKGFTRSPTENDVIVCPSCNEELIHDKTTDEPIAKRGGKQPSRKEREEHPFWVVKECGHVYCNNCFQRRASPAKYENVTFEETTKSSSSKRGVKALLCAIDGCQSDVKSKEKWIGLFL